jgi:proteasome accessory factor C
MGRLGASERMQRLLALVPWVAAHDGPTIAEVCERFDLEPKTLLRDLETLMFVGVYPYTPAELIEVVVEEGRVWIRYADYFQRPLRLTAEEALTLVAASQALLSAPGADPGGALARALRQLAGSLHLDPEAAEVRLEPVDSATLDVLRRATVEHRPVEVDYYAFGRDELTHRVIEPFQVYADQGQWYVAAHCRSAGAERVFRVDRVHGAELLDERFEPPHDPPTLGVFQPRPEDPRVTLRLRPEAGWVLEQYPIESAVPLAEGGVEVTLVVSARLWLARLLLRLGPQAQVVRADAGLDDVAGEAARQVLSRYR